ncbi:phosphoenolpyruvate-protein phosphotransferase PtsI [Enterobacterales bacterium endosymbiont of Anomoneura mori]|uniref:phosphoenolpyruvate--protein phosphotransferase n=1 Tax=Enterobacterales bacterium endosymbiont of Anomoneura mori TaxID=3132096 RepID=UPI00399D2569
MISGTSVSKGIAFGKALLLKDEKILINKKNILKKNIDKEIQRFYIGQKKTIEQIKKIKEINKKKISKKEEEIFNSHIMILEDYEFENEIIYLIKKKLITADYAVNKIINKQIKTFKKIKNNYFKERANDINDIGKRLLKNILNYNILNLNYIKDKVILISKDLTPSETAQLDLKKVLGFITELGGITSHTSIMAKSLELPAIINTYNVTKIIKNNDYIILDANDNKIYINPDLSTINLIKKKNNIYIKDKKKLQKNKNLPAITLDGHKVSIFANICNLHDIKFIKKYGAEGIGLYRTEFLFMNRDNLPNINEQIKSYKYIFKKNKDNPIIIRTMDIGGDKNIPYLNFLKEDNPFLGWRAIRISIDYKEILYNQLKSILLASIYGNVKIMFPMITTIEEIYYLKYELKNIEEELKIKKKKIKKNIKIGIMIETPSAAMMIKEFAKEVDFFSIGTNDLTQYTLAVDRGNKLVSHLYNPLNPSVLKIIKKIIDDAHKYNKYVSMCGEFASDEKVTLLLLGMGLDGFSMNSSYIPQIKNIIRNNKYKDSKKLANLILKQNTLKDILNCLKINKFK